MTLTAPATSHSVEGIARVVRIDGALAWLEPEQSGGCGSCAAASSCGAGAGLEAETTGLGTVARRMEARRFALDNPDGLRVGERVVVGVDPRSLLKAALTAYAMPLVTALTAGGIAEGAFGNDLVSMAATVSGLACGLLMARIAARQLARGGELSPRVLRRAGGSRGFAAPHGFTNRRSEPPAPSSAVIQPQQVAR